MEIVLIGAAGLMIFCIFLFARNAAVFSLQMRLLKEESEYTRKHLDVWARKGKGKFLRLDSLPPYDKMVYQFWRPLNYYTKKLKPLEEYYPRMRRRDND